MPSSTMATIQGITPPHCFCFKPAIIIHTRQHGMIFECHSTDLSLWPEQQEASLKNNIESSPSSQAQSSSTRSIPGSPQSPVNDKAIKDIAISLKEIANTTKAQLLPSWGERPVANKISHISPFPFSRLKSPAIRTATKLLRPSNSRQNLVCGFHMHADLWEKFKSLAVPLERASRERSMEKRMNEQRDQAHDQRQRIWWGDTSIANQDFVLAKYHHAIVLRHPSLYIKFRTLADKSQCLPNCQTIGRWANAGEELFGGETSPLGGAPLCACGLRMKLSWQYQGQEWSVVYFCTLRLGDTKNGCSRVANAGKWVQWQDMEPIHPVAQLDKDQMSGHPLLQEVVEPEIEDVSSDEEINPAEDVGGERETTEHMESEGEDLSENEENGEDDEPSWDENIACSPSMTRSLKVMPLPSGLVEIEELVKKKSELGMVAEASSIETVLDEESVWLDNVRKDSEGNRWLSDNYMAESSQQWSAEPWSEEVNSRDKSIAGEELMKEIRALVVQLEDTQNILGPKQAMADQGMIDRENSLMVLQESCDRMKAYTMRLYADGLDNPTLKCRICKEGLLMCANVPCFHLVMCDNCIQAYPECVACNSTIEGSQRVFWG